MEALARGIRAAGDELVPPGERADCAIAKYWGDALRLYELGHKNVLVCELGFLGDRRKWCHLAWDGLAGRGIHVAGPERAPPVLELWQARSAGYALLLGQVPDDWAVRLALKDTPYAWWIAETRRMLERHGFEVRYRKHPELAMLDPLPPRPPSDWRRRRELRQTVAPRRPTLREELAGARIAVTLNSTSAIEAVCLGVPTWTLDRRGSMAGAVSAELGGRWLSEEPPHRRAWVNRLARLQWSLEELADGTAWRALRDNLLGRSGV
jgi:hypothetical protein